MLELCCEHSRTRTAGLGKFQFRILLLLLGLVTLSIAKQQNLIVLALETGQCWFAYDHALFSVWHRVLALHEAPHGPWLS